MKRRKYRHCVSPIEPLESRRLLSGAFEGALENAIAYHAGSQTLYLAYYDSAESALKSAKRQSNGDWVQLEDIDSGECRYVTMALDNNGVPGVAYYKATPADLYYARFNGTEWDVEAVDAPSTGKVGLYPSLAYNPNPSSNLPAISYYDKTRSSLKFKRRLSSTPGDWTLPTVIEDEFDVGRYSSLKWNPNTSAWRWHMSAPVMKAMA
jgi:hypothetical protein